MNRVLGLQKLASADQAAAPESSISAGLCSSVSGGLCSSVSAGLCGAAN
jgi:hypothetical protein